MSNENTANLPHDVQEAIKAAKEKAEKEKAKGVRQDVQGAVDKVQSLILESHLRTCVTTAVRGEDPDERERVLREISEVFRTQTPKY